MRCNWWINVFLLHGDSLLINEITVTENCGFQAVNATNSFYGI